MAGGWRRRVGWVAGFLAALVALIVVLPPLVLRGRVLHWVVGRATSGLCGDFALGDGHLGWTVVPALLLGRPFTIELEEAHIRTPDGTEIIGVSRVSARVAIARNPWRITIDQAVAERGGWRLTDGGPPGTGFVDAFRQVPAGTTRTSACLERHVHGQGKHALSSGTSLVVRDVRLEEIDADLQFRDWGLKLPRVRAHGSLTVGAPGSAGILFEARDVVAPGGSLRIGKVTSHGMARVSFDEVAIAHVAASPEQPTDIVLTVTGGRTGRSVLSGTAVFENVFKLPMRPRKPPGMRLNARYVDLADVLARFDAGWMPRGGTLEDVGLGGTLTVRLDGPFKELTGTVTADGPRARVEAQVESGRQASADVRAKGLELGPLLNPGLRPLFAGRASGRLRASVDLPRRDADVDARIDEADVTLDRAPGGPGPRHLEVHVSPSGRGARGHVPTSTADTLALSLESARFHDATLEVEGARVRWAGLSAGGRLALALPRPAPVDPPPTIHAVVDVTLTSLSRWVAPERFDASGKVRATVSGPLDHVRAEVAFDRKSSMRIVRERFRAPAEATVTLDGRTLSVSELRFLHDGGGEVAARLRGELDRDLGGHLEIRDYPLARVPAFADIKPPYVLGAPAGVSLADVLEGTLNATFDVHGTLSHPRAKGTTLLTGVRLVGRPLPDGRFDVLLAPLRATIAGSLGPTLSVQGTGGSGPRGAAATANLKLDQFAVAPWLPRPLDQLISTVSGTTRLAIEPGREPLAAAALRLQGPAGDLQLDGTLTASSIRGEARGRVEVAGLRPVWSRALSQADGAIDIDLRGGLDYSHPTLDELRGTVAIARPLRAQPVHSQLVLEAGTGGHITVDGPRFATEGLAVTTPGARAQVDGEVRVDVEAPARSMVALAAAGQLDVGAIARRVSIRMLRSASGSATFDVRAKGEAAAPAITGQARFDGVEVQPTAAAWPAVRLDGSIEASGHTVSTHGLRVQTTPFGSLMVGGAQAPASVELLSLAPPQLGRVDVPVTARGLHVGGPGASLQIRSLDLTLRVAGDQEALAVRGDVGIAGATFDPKRVKKSGTPGPSKPWFESLPPQLSLDLTLHGPGDAVTVAVPMLPDVSVNFACHVVASHQGAQLSGQLRGSGLYSRMAVTVYDWFKSQDVRACRVMK
jgi:hypothetical protein